MGHPHVADQMNAGIAADDKNKRVLVILTFHRPQSCQQRIQLKFINPRTGGLHFIFSECCKCNNINRTTIVP